MESNACLRVPMLVPLLVDQRKKEHKTWGNWTYVQQTIQNGVQNVNNKHLCDIVLLCLKDGCQTSLHKNFSPLYRNLESPWTSQVFRSCLKTFCLCNFFRSSGRNWKNRSSHVPWFMLIKYHVVCGKDKDVV